MGRHPATAFAAAFRSLPTPHHTAPPPSLEVEEVGVVIPVIHGTAPVGLLVPDQLPAVLALHRSTARRAFLPQKVQSVVHFVQAARAQSLARVHARQVPHAGGGCRNGSLPRASQPAAVKPRSKDTSALVRGKRHAHCSTLPTEQYSRQYSPRAG